MNIQETVWLFVKINTDFQRVIKTSLKSRSRANLLKPFHLVWWTLGYQFFLFIFLFLPSNHEIQSITNFNVKQRVNNEISNYQFHVLLNILYFKCRPTKNNNMKTNTWTRRQCYVRMEDTQQNACIFMKIKIKFKIFFFFFFSRKLILCKKKPKTKMFALKWHIQN